MNITLKFKGDPENKARVKVKAQVCMIGVGKMASGELRATTKVLTKIADLMSDIEEKTIFPHREAED